MAPLDRPIVVADAGPLIHLDELGCLDLLADFSTVYTTQPVWREVLRHRPALAPETIPGLRVEKSVWPVGSAVMAMAEAFDLDTGEVSALGLMQHLSADLFLCDDAAARLVAESLGYGVHGTIGLVIRAIRRQQCTKPQVLEILRAIPTRSTLFIKPSLLAEIYDRVVREG
jgi:predicted nucleic acid-binding protein